MKISRYLSPQIYKSIFSGQKDVTIQTERKKLTIFFSDIKDFTATTERLQPEQITQLLNEYFTEMSKIALRAWRHHRQVHRRRHADLLRRSGNQGRCRGRQGLPAHGGRDAAADRRPQCQMAQRRHRAPVPRAHGHQHRLSATSAISAAPTGWTTRSSAPRRTSPRACNRSPSPGSIVVSYETYALVRDIVVAQALPPITMKGISREVVPYAVNGMIDATARRCRCSASTSPGSISI